MMQCFWKYPWINKPICAIRTILKMICSNCRFVLRERFPSPVSSCSFANAAVVQEDSSNGFCLPYRGSIHMHQLISLNCLLSLVPLHLEEINLSSQEACRGRNQRASCDHFYLTEDCLVWYPCRKKRNEWADR